MPNVASNPSAAGTGRKGGSPELSGGLYPRYIFILGNFGPRDFLDFICVALSFLIRNKCHGSDRESRYKSLETKGLTLDAKTNPL